MSPLIDWVAPRSRLDLALKAVAFLALIHAADFATSRLTGNGAADPLADVVDTTIIALPFVVFILAVLRQQRQLQAHLAVLATTDLLTGLPNRRDFLARARPATEGGRPGALLLLDADHFKRINDRWGHAAGDDCLAAIAERLRASLGPGDLVGRMGGEEFAVFLPGASRDEALAAGERLCSAIAVQARDAEEALAVTLSAGGALGCGATPLDRLMVWADRALYEAKAMGRGRVVIWPPEEPARSPDPGALDAAGTDVAAPPGSHPARGPAPDPSRHRGDEAA